ncbi:MAG: hypothetical protein RBS17_00530 [Coriobacteriia bacterium]|nr:hypothetical protein [Coriobacteriia bacterium]
MDTRTRTRTRRQIDIVAALTVVCLVAVVLCVDAMVAPQAGWSATGTVQVTAVVRSTLDVDFDDDHLTVRANTPWQVSADLADGERWSFEGGPTGGYDVVVPQGATGVEVCAR